MGEETSMGRAAGMGRAAHDVSSKGQVCIATGQQQAAAGQQMQHVM
jgi:hypothetical protein